MAQVQVKTNEEPKIAEIRAIIKKAFGIDEDLKDFGMRRNNFEALEITSFAGDRGYVIFNKRNDERDPEKVREEYCDFYRSVLRRKVRMTQINDGYGDMPLLLFYWKKRREGEILRRVVLNNGDETWRARDKE